MFLAYKYSTNPKDFNVPPIRPYDRKDRVTNGNLVDYIYSYVNLEISPVVGLDVFTDRICFQASDKLERRIDTKFENGFRYLKGLFRGQFCFLVILAASLKSLTVFECKVGQLFINKFGRLMCIKLLPQSQL